MSPLPSPEERRKQLRIVGVPTVPRRGTPPTPWMKSAASEERAQQRKEGRRRAKQTPRG